MAKIIRLARGALWGLGREVDRYGPGEFDSLAMFIGLSIGIIVGTVWLAGPSFRADVSRNLCLIGLLEAGQTSAEACPPSLPINVAGDLGEAL